MRDRISTGMVAAVTALSLVTSVLLLAEPADAQQWRGERGGYQGGTITLGPTQPDSWSSGWGASAPDWSDDPCWQVRPIYSVSGAWLNNQRVNVCH
jgi:hypothetical protein